MFNAIIQLVLMLTFYLGPITKISCARFYNSLHFMTAFGQEKPAYESSADKCSYVRLIKTRGDASSQVKLTVPAPCPSAEILESELVPSSTTAEDDQKQLNILFLNHQASSFNTCIWQITPKDSAKEILNLSMNLNDCKTSIIGRNQTYLDSNMLIKNSPQQVIQTLLNHQQYGKKRELPDTPFEINASHKKRKGSTETISSSQETQAIDIEMEEASIPVENLNEEPIIAMVRDDEVLQAFSPDNEFISFHTSQNENSNNAVFNECSIGESSGDIDLEQVVFEGIKDDADDDKKNLNVQEGHINTKDDVQDEKDTLKDTYLQISENAGVMSDVVHLQVGAAATLKEDNTDNSDVTDDAYDGDDEFYDSQEDFDGNVEDGMILKKEEVVYARLSDDDDDNETDREPLPTSSHYDGYAFGEVYFPQVVDDVHPLSPRYGNTDFTYHSEPSFTDDYDEEDYMDEVPRYRSMQEAGNKNNLLTAKINKVLTKILFRRSSR